jgi:hypothetical protein
MVYNVNCQSYLHNTVKRYLSFMDEYLLLVKGFESITKLEAVDNAILMEVVCDDIPDEVLTSFVKEFTGLVDMVSIVYTKPYTAQEKKAINKIITNIVQSHKKEKALYKRLHTLNSIRQKVYEKHVFKGF